MHNGANEGPAKHIDAFMSKVCQQPKKNTPHFRTRCFQFYFGGTSGGRTHDKRIKSPLLYQLSYGPITLDIQPKFRTLRSLKV